MNHVQTEIRIDFDVKGWKFVYITDEFLKITGYSRNDIRKLFHDNFLEMLTKEDVQYIKTDFIKNVKNNKCAEMDFKMHCAGDSFVWVNIQANIAIEENKNYIDLLVFETTKYHEWIEKSEQNLISLEKSIPGGVSQVCFDKNFSVMWYNDCYLNIIGYTKEQFQNELHCQASGFVNSEDLINIGFLIEECVLKNEYSFTIEMNIKRRDGKERILMNSFSLLPVEIGEIQILFSIGIDITEYKKSLKDTLSSKHYRIALEQTSNCVWEYDIESKCILGSESIEKFFGISNNIENVPNSLVETGVVHPDSAQVFYEMFEKLEAGDAHLSGNVQMRSANGEYIRVSIRQAVIFDELGKSIKAIALIDDITEKHRLEVLYEEGEKHRKAMTFDSNFACQLNLNENKIIYVNEKEFSFFSDNIECSAETLINKFANEYISSEYSELYLNTFKKEYVYDMYEKGIPEITIEYQIFDVENILRWNRAKVQIIKDPEKGDIIVYVYVKDIHEDKEQELQLRRQAEQDSLTQLYNRLTAELKIESYIDAHKQDQSIHAIYMIDIDNFKYINDMFGHTYGDYILINTANILKDVFSEDDIIGRMGGDEFIVFMKNCISYNRGIDKAEEVCNKLKHVFENSADVSVSVGIAFVPRDGYDFAELYNSADIALYGAKRKGKNCYEIHSDKLHHRYSSSKKVSVSREWLLDESNDMIYVSDFYSYELLYMNKGAKKLFNVDNNEKYKGQKCYKVLQNKDKPCEFCTNHLLCREKFYTWEFKNESIGHYFILKDRIVDWYGAPARIELASDITDRELEHQNLEKQVKIDKIIIECMRELNSSKTLDKTAVLLLEHMGKFYQADRVYIKQFSTDKCDSLKYEWINEGITVLNPKLIESEDDIKITVSLTVNGRTMGIIELYNPREYKDDVTVLETLGYFISEEITKRQLSQRLEFLGYHDALTGLSNRNRYIEYLKEIEKRDLMSLGIAVADINELKVINGDYGYLGGDKVIQSTASILKKCFTNAGIYRLSGDEFLIVCENIERNKFIKFVQVVKNELEEQGGRGVSLGSAWSDIDIDINTLMIHSNEIMMIEKQEHYKNFKYSGKRNFNRVKELIKYIKNGNFKMYLQPKANCLTRKISGAEALVRFVSEENEVHPPGKFIHIMEKEGTIKYIDLFIFEEVCRTLAKWRLEGRTLIPISLNFSRLTILEPGIIDIVSKIQKRYDVPRYMIEIEITETLGEFERETIAEIGKAIKLNGFGLALDDFGSSYTNMAILTIIPADVLKLDRSLIRNMMSSEKNRIILKYILQMCREMGVSSIAEGVETEEQFDLLKELECEAIQGYLLDKPITLSEFEKKFV